MGRELDFESHCTGEIERDAQVAKEEHQKYGSRRSLQSGTQA